MSPHRTLTPAADSRPPRGSPWRAPLGAAAAVLGLPLLGLALWLGGVALFTRWSPYGLRVTYFADPALRNPVTTAWALEALRDYRVEPPPRAVPRDAFSTRWEGWLVAPVSTTYQFFAQSEDGILVRLAGELLIDNWHATLWLQSGQRAERTLAAGAHALTIETFHTSPRAGVRIRWAGGPIPPNTLLAMPHLRKPDAPPAALE